MGIEKKDISKNRKVIGYQKINNPEVNNTTPLSNKPISEEELKNLINLNFKRNNIYYEVIKEAVDSLTVKYKKNLRDLILTIRQGVSPNFEFDDKGEKVIRATFSKKLTDEELYNYAMAIPVEMYFINNCMENKALDMEISKYLKELDITEEIRKLGKVGTEKERLRTAEYNTMISAFTSIIKDRVYYNLKNEIDAVNRVYEAIKKVISARMQDKQIFGKDDSNY